MDLFTEIRKAKGLERNYPEAVADISAEILKLKDARECKTVAEIMSYGTT